MRSPSLRAAAFFLVLMPACITDAAAGAAVTLQLRDLDGQMRDLADSQGRIVVLNFWATWCLPCRDEMPVFVEIQKQYADRDVQVIAVSTDEAATQPEIPRFRRKHHMRFPVWVGAGVEEMRRFGLAGALPATVLIDRDGSVAEILQGAVERDDLASRLEWLLGDREGPQPSPFVAAAPPAPEEHQHEAGEEHEHGAAAMEGASLVPS